MSAPLDDEDISDWEDNQPPSQRRLNHHQYSPDHHKPNHIPKQRLTKTKNSKIYFSDSDDFEIDEVLSSHKQTRPLLSSSDPKGYARAQQTPKVADDKPAWGQQQTPTQPSRVQQQHHRRHRQFHRTFTPLDLRQLNCSEGSTTSLSALGTLTPTHSCDGPSSNDLTHGQQPLPDWSADHCQQQHLSLGAVSLNSTELVASSPLQKLVSLDSDREARRSRRGRIMLFNYGAESICVLALILTTFATFQNVPPKISKLSVAQPFFLQGSLVHDFPAGNLNMIQERVKMSDVSLVMFYAPWSAECQYARHSYEQVARLFYREVHFGAVNCWQPGGECRHQYAKIHDWPVAMAYLKSGLAVPYTGRWSVASLTKFVRALMHPLHRVIDNEDMLRLMMSHDAVVVAFLDIDQYAEDYAAFYSTAVKWLEQDPFQSVAFAVVTGASTTNFGVHSPLVRTYLWNGTMEYDTQNVWTQPKLTAWINQQIIRVSVWLNLPGVKAATLAPHFKNGPALLLFTPRNMDSTKSVDAYDMLRQLGLEYHNCESVNQPWIKEMSRIYITEVRKENRKEFNKFAAQCDRIVAEAERAKATKQCRFRSSETAVRSVSFGHIMNSSKLPIDFCQIGPKNEGDSYDEETCSPKYLEKHISHGCSHSDSPKQSHGKGSMETSMLDSEHDQRSPINLELNELRKRCEIFVHGQKREDHPKAVFFETADDWDQFDRIAASSCDVNRTMSFVAIDSMMFHVFAERLGVDVGQRQDETVAIIVDHENESTYVMDEPVSTIALIEFVQNFTNGKLPRFLNARAKDLTGNRLNSTHPTFDAVRPKKFPTPGNLVPSKRTIGQISLSDVDSHTFSRDVINSNKTVFLLYYSAQCAMCTVLSQALLMAAHMLADLCPHLNFARIDGDRNDLPWQYTVDQYPTLIVYPTAQQSMESRVFPVALPATVPNVLTFVLANLRRPLRLQALLLVCNHIRKQFSVDDCARTIRREISDSIAISLRHWRTVPHRRGAILRRLQALQRIYLQLHQFDRIDSKQRRHLIAMTHEITKLWPAMFTATAT